MPDSVKRDENFVPCGWGVSSVDGVTPVPLTVDTVTGRLRVKVAGNSGNNGNGPDTSYRRAVTDPTNPVIHGQENGGTRLYPFTIETANNGVMML